MQVKLLGVKISHYQKDGQDMVAANYYGVKPFTEYEMKNCLCDGASVVSEYARKDFGVRAGDIVDFVYEPGFKDKATLVDIVPLAIADKPPFKEGSGAGPQKAAETKQEDQKAKQ